MMRDNLFTKEAEDDEDDEEEEGTRQSKKP
jgi:hypothetical protein